MPIDPETLAAFRSARSETFIQNGRAIRPAPAGRALAYARERLESAAAAMEAYSDATAAHDAAAALAAPFLSAGFGVHTLTPPDAAPAIRAAQDARAKMESALRRATSARSLCQWFAGGFWTRRPASGWGEGRTFHLYESNRGAGVLRHVQDAQGVRGCRDVASYYDNPHGESFKDGSGLVIPVVAQLRARNGRAQWVAGWRHGGMDDAGAFDLSRVYVASGPTEEESEEAAQDAARAADSLAERAAEREREYQGAWGAGREWAEEGERVETLRRDALALLAERRAARTLSPALFPNLCETVRRRVSDIWADIQEARERRRTLADGDDSTFFHMNDATARAAFCDGAGIELESFPA